MRLTPNLPAILVGLSLSLRASEALVIEAEDFQFAGSWICSQDLNASHRQLLQLSPESGNRVPSYDAVTLVPLDAAGAYTFWVRSRDFAKDRPKSRRFAVSVDGQAFDIESATMGKQAAPLALLSAAVLSRSEAFWAERALPTFEFVLSRRKSDIIRSGINQNGVTIKGQISVPGQFYGTTCWEGLQRLTAGLNPWLTEFALPNGSFRHANAYNASAPWTEMLAANRLSPTAMPLGKVSADAKDWVTRAIYAVLTADAVPGVQVTSACGDAVHACERYPYEASFYPVRDPNTPVRVTVLVPGQEAQSIELNR